MQKIGKYQISHRLGRGGMAEVWLGNHPTLNRQVAIKVLHRFLGEAAGFEQRFIQEARLVASLRHPNIVQLYDFDIDKGRPFMVMEYLRGGTLYDWLNLRPEPTLPLTEVVPLFGQIAKGLSYAHQQGAIHRDLKPANILLTERGEPVISDFGIAKLLHKEGNMSGTGSAIGTPNYMSPEQALGGKVDGRSDIYALGVMLFELMTGVLPFEAESPAGLLSQHINKTPPSPRWLNSALSPEVEQIILRALAKEPAVRFSDAVEMSEALFNSLGDQITAVDYETGLETLALMAASGHQSAKDHSATLGSMITPSQISNLPDLSSMGLSVALVLAVANRPLSHLMLADILGEKDETILGALDELWQFDIVMLEDQMGEYLLKELWVQQKIYHQASPAKRTLLHRKCGEVLMQQIGRDGHFSAWEAGSHFERAGIILQAVQLYLQGLTEQFEENDGVNLLELDLRSADLVSLVEQHPNLQVDRSHIYFLRAVAVSRVAGWDAADIPLLLRKAGEYVDQSGSADLPLCLLIARWLAEFFGGSLERAQAAGQAVMQLVQSSGREELWSIGHLILGLTLLESQRYEPAKTNFLRGLDHFQNHQIYPCRLLFKFDIGLLLRIALTYTSRQLGGMSETRQYEQQTIIYAQNLAGEMSESS